jgi:hypothetical protein
MSIALHWYLPTHGDGRTLVQAGAAAQLLQETSRPDSAGTGREATLRYLAQVVPLARVYLVKSIEIVWMMASAGRLQGSGDGSEPRAHQTDRPDAHPRSPSSSGGRAGPVGSATARNASRSAPHTGAALVFARSSGGQQYA